MAGELESPRTLVSRRFSAEERPLRVLLGRARGLKVKNLLDNSSDPYCVLSLPPGEEYRPDLAALSEFSHTSRTCNRTLEPQWYEEVALPTSRDNQVLQVEVHDQKFWTAKLPGTVTDRFHHMGTARVALKDIRYSPTWVPLLDKSGKPVGELEISRVVDGAVNHETHQYRKFYSKAANVLQGKLGSAYIVQEVEMYHVDDIFKGFRAGWNRDYRAAQMIFSGTPDALAIRAAVQAQHYWLYNNIPSPETGAISGGEQLLQLFGFGKRRGKTRAYTWVLVEVPAADGGEKQFMFRFSETGIKLAKDYLSKHAMHACGAEEVIYSGEFHVADINGEKTLVLDNNSGTYAPDKAMLPALATVFVRNFDGLKVLTFDRDDPALSSIIEKLKPCRESETPLPASLASATPQPIPEAI